MSSVSIVIPTRNSASTLERCLNAVRNQTFRDIETIVVDSNSNDATVNIASHFASKVIQTNQRLLGSRILGFQESNGEFAVMLDSDQILSSDTIEKCVKESDKFDMICLEERAHRPRTIIEKLYDMDRKFINETYLEQLNPEKGAILPRFFKREILTRAIESMREGAKEFVVAHDHAIIYYESSKISKKIGFVRNAVWHIEPSNYYDVWKKNFNYGKTTRLLSESGYYSDLIRAKTWFRPSHPNQLSLQLASAALLCLKGVPYWLGYLCG